MSKIKVSVVSYLNSKVFIKGLMPFAENDFDFSLDIPAVCAEKLINNQVDIGLIPIAVIPEINNAEIISNYCISANGAVNSVFLFSNTPIEKIKKIYLDLHSRTSNVLCKILVNEFWKIEVDFVQQDIDVNNLKAGEAFVLIGDRTFNQIDKFTTQLDLALHWKTFTGLPFVFAAWVANKNIDELSIKNFNHYLAQGFHYLDDVINENLLPNFDVSDYLQHKIEYNLNDEKRKAIDLYLSKAKLYR